MTRAIEIFDYRHGDRIGKTWKGKMLQIRVGSFRFNLSLTRRYQDTERDR